MTEQTLLSGRSLAVTISLLMVPVLTIVLLSFFSTSTNGSVLFSFEGIKEIFSQLRSTEILKIAQRAFLVCLIVTALSYFLAYLLVQCSRSFQSLFLIFITLPFISNESVRVFSWQYLLSENGALNKILSAISRHNVNLFNGANSANVYAVMIISCIPFGIFINAASVKTIPGIYWNVANDLKLNPLSKFLKVALPLSKSALVTTATVVFFISFAMSAEVNFLGGDTKISLRNLISSLMSASKFSSIFSIGFFITGIIVGILIIINVLRTRTSISGK